MDLSLAEDWCAIRRSDSLAQKVKLFGAKGNVEMLGTAKKKNVGRVVIVYANLSSW